MTHNDRLVNKLMYAREGFLLLEYPTRGMPFLIFFFFVGVIGKEGKILSEILGF